MPLCAAFAPALAKGSCQESCWSHERSRTTYCTVRLKTAVLHLLLYCLLCCTLLPFNFYPYVSGLRIPSLNPPAYTSQAFYLFISISSIPPPQLLKKKKLSLYSLHDSFPASFLFRQYYEMSKIKQF